MKNPANLPRLSASFSETTIPRCSCCTQRCCSGERNFAGVFVTSSSTLAALRTMGSSRWKWGVHHQQMVTKWDSNGIQWGFNGDLMVFNWRESPIAGLFHGNVTKMDDFWGYPYVRKPPIMGMSSRKIHGGSSQCDSWQPSGDGKWRKKMI